MQDAQYITRSDLDAALAKHHADTATLVAQVVAKELRDIGGNGRAPSPTDAPATDRTLESNASLILQGIESLKDEVALNRNETELLRHEVKGELRELRTDVEGIKTDVEGIKTDVEGLKTDVVELKVEVAVVKTEQASIRKEIASTARELRADIKAECEVLRREFKTESEVVRGDIKELRGEARMIKWGFGFVLGTMLAGLTLVHESVRDELHTSFGGLREEVGELRKIVVDAVERLVRLETRQSTD